MYIVVVVLQGLPTLGGGLAEDRVDAQPLVDGGDRRRGDRDYEYERDKDRRRDRRDDEYESSRRDRDRRRDRSPDRHESDRRRDKERDRRR